MDDAENAVKTIQNCHGLYARWPVDWLQTVHPWRLNVYSKAIQGVLLNLSIWYSTRYMYIGSKVKVCATAATILT